MDLIRPRHLAEHWIKHKDAEFIRIEAEKYAKPEELKEMIKKYIALMKRNNFNPKEK